MFFDHPIAALVSRLSSSHAVVPDETVVLASVDCLRAELLALDAVLAEPDADLTDVVVPMLRAYFGAVVVASQVARASPVHLSETHAAFADQAQGVLTVLGRRVGPAARAIAARVLGARGSA